MIIMETEVKDWKSRDLFFLWLHTNLSLKVVVGRFLTDYMSSLNIMTFLQTSGLLFLIDTELVFGAFPELVSIGLEQNLAICSLSLSVCLCLCLSVSVSLSPIR